ncbi:DUF1365 domain-containing protein [Delftia sp. PS-11]|uniref:DUF1365 domain-containing protein n=1 Tax=Delftia sp. PS-11 TaxID=2767222 RepID=UPI002454E654|nr:DUF1365 domain-containing protein [Delftia sp. PS-11]KAJ8742545.1 DUF1365 domain-containing protein [Delftia sp. PS-11]
MSCTQPEPAAPLIGFGHVWHRRLRPAEHAFRYRGYFLMLPMRSLCRQPSAALRRNRFGWLSFHDRDHGDGGADALSWFEQLLHSEGIADADGEIWLHTFPRVLGYVFKPVSFWYAHRADGSLAAVVAEVNNTFGERHAYLLAGPDLGWGTTQVADKCFHVSPFCTVQGEYRFRFERTADRTLVRVDLHDDAGPLLQTSVGGALEPLDAASVRRAFFGTPLMTLAVIVRIHWQALRLWAKRVPFHGKPPEPKRFVTR